MFEEINGARDKRRGTRERQRGREKLDEISTKPDYSVLVRRMTFRIKLHPRTHARSKGTTHIPTHSRSLSAISMYSRT